MFNRHFQFAHGMIGLRGNWNGDDAVRRIRLRSCQYPGLSTIEHVKLHGPTRVAVIRIKPPTIPGADMTLTTKSVDSLDAVTGVSSYFNQFRGVVGLIWTN